jgi:hypothetical protein
MRQVILANVLITLVLVAIFDGVAFYFLPDAYVRNFPEYRHSVPDSVGGRVRYPHGYFVADETRGFDIGKDRKGSHWVEGITYPIWSNSYGCFDTEHAEVGEYVYFAGDSLTWGYAPFEQKFGTLVERISGATVFKCGVTHTGQRHQVEKLSQIAAELGHPPGAIFVFYFSNDIANDYAHPHSTVVDGWQLDRILLDSDYQLVPRTDEELRRGVESRLAEQRGIRSGAKRFLKRYSLTLNILDYARDRGVQWLDSLRTTSTAVDAAPGQLVNLYDLPQEKNGRYWYLENPRAQANKSALLDLKKFSATNDAELIVVLIPPQEKATDTEWYAEVRHFLADNGIEYVDLASEFRDLGLGQEDLYWQRDVHLSTDGNRIVAEILVEEFAEVFPQRP